MLSLVYGVGLLTTNYHRQLSMLDLATANRVTFHPVTLALVAILAVLATAVERRLENTPEFPVGLLIGELSVLLTTLLNVLVLVWGGKEDWPFLVLVTVVPHILIAGVEGTILGFTVGFLARVKPDLVGWSTPEEAECLVNAGP
jgi:hypothetical protein